MNDLTQFLERDTEYSPATKAAYKFTRPVNSKGEKAEYFDLMLDIYFNMHISRADVMNRSRRMMYAFSGRGMEMTVQNLRMQSLVYLLEGDYYLTANGSAYVVNAMRNLAKIKGVSFGELLRQYRNEFTK